MQLYGREPVELERSSSRWQPTSNRCSRCADFAGIPPRVVRLETLECGVRFAARGSDDVLRATTVTANTKPASADDGRLRFLARLVPGQAADVGLRFELHQDRDAPGVSKPACHGRTDARERSDELPPGHMRVRADDELFNRVLQRSLLDLRMLRSQLDGDAYYAAGVPWFAALFGRDSLITAIEMLAFDPSMAAQTLRVLARRLGRRVDPVHEEEPGKVLHELRQGEVAAIAASPLTRYYGTVDATPLFLCLLAEHADWTGTLDLFHELDDAVDAALGWIDRYADHDGDGLLDYRASTPGGLRNQGWKDSDDGVPDEHGAPLEPPIALVEAQAYAVRAKRAMGGPTSGRATRGARASWLAGRMSCALGWSASGFRSAASTRSVSTAPGARAGHWRPTRATSCGPAPSTPSAGRPYGTRSWATRCSPVAGVRTLGRGEVAFNPVGYHVGTVWPHDTALCAVGLRNYGYDEDFVLLFEALLEAASHAEDYRLPELFAGFSRSQFETPVPYPVACHPQAWAAAAIPYLLTSGLGLHADGMSRSLRIRRPSLPRWVNRVEVEGLRVAGARPTCC